MLLVQSIQNGCHVDTALHPESLDLHRMAVKLNSSHLWYEYSFSDKFQ
jgi:hypothetical protein